MRLATKMQKRAAKMQVVEGTNGVDPSSSFHAQNDSGVAKMYEVVSTVTGLKEYRDLALLHAREKQVKRIV